MFPLQPLFEGGFIDCNGLTFLAGSCQFCIAQGLQLADSHAPSSAVASALSSQFCRAVCSALLFPPNTSPKPISVSNNVHKTIPASFTNANCLPPIFIKSILLRVQAPALPPPLPPCQQPLAHPKSSRNLRECYHCSVQISKPCEAGLFSIPP